MVRRLSAEETLLWHKVIETVRPIEPERATERVARDGIPKESPTAPPRRPTGPAVAIPAPKTGKGPGTLDSTWDRRLSRGQLQPDLSLDLHGHNLATAHERLDQKLGEAIAAGARLMLLVTGKPRTDPVARRGAIRAAVGDWLSASRHSADIAAIRNAHPRHGGAGALYIIFRRKRTGPR